MSIREQRLIFILKNVHYSKNFNAKIYNLRSPGPPCLCVEKNYLCPQILKRINPYHNEK